MKVKIVEKYVFVGQKKSTKICPCGGGGGVGCVVHLGC